MSITQSELSHEMVFDFFSNLCMLLDLAQRTTLSSVPSLAGFKRGGGILWPTTLLFNKSVAKYNRLQFHVTN